MTDQLVKLGGRYFDVAAPTWEDNMTVNKY